MRISRFLGGSLVTVAFLAACGDTQPTNPGTGSELARAGQNCTIADDAAAKVRTVSAGCVNSEVTVPEGWTLRVEGGAAPAPSLPAPIGPQQIEQIENPTPDYVDNTTLVDISGIADFTLLTEVTEGDQTISFSISMDKRSVPFSWGTWADPPFVEPGTPHILFTQGAQELTIELSEPARTFGFELGPNPFAFHTFTAEFYSGATLVGSITREISGENGARLMAATSLNGAFDRVEVSGTSDFSIGRIRFGDVEPGEPAIPVEIDDMYSGDPRQDPGTIHLGDDWVYAEILNIEQYIPRMASADDVRIGDDWETGVAAESFEILDINQDGNRDIRVRWDLDEVANAGHLPTGRTTVTVWGYDAENDDLYRGDADVEVIDNGEIVACFDNGDFVTHPGQGAGGADVSMAAVEQDQVSYAGSNVQQSLGGPHFRIADDFQVDAGGCTVARIVTHGYQTGAANPTWTNATLNIYDHGPPFNTPIASATTTDWEWSGVYRVFNGLANLGNTQRPVHEIHFSFPNVELSEGTYWIEWQVVGGASGWANYVMEPDPQGGANTSTVYGNGQQMHDAAGSWQPTLFPPGAEVPFRVYGADSSPARGQHGQPFVQRGWQNPAGYADQQADGAQ